jgi:hypothetical protein
LVVLNRPATYSPSKATTGVTMNIATVSISPQGIERARQLIDVISLIGQAAPTRVKSEAASELDEVITLFLAAINTAEMSPPPRTGTVSHLSLVK